MLRKYSCLYRALYLVWTAIGVISTDKPHAVDTWAQVDLIQCTYSESYLRLNYNVFNLDRSIACLDKPE